MSLAIRLMDIEKNFKHLRSRYKELRRTNPQDALTKITLFYAVECGVKATLAKKYHYHRHKWLEKECTIDIGHKLNKGFKKLKIPLTINTATAKDSPPEQDNLVHHHQLHEAWRYGRALNEPEERQTLERLEKGLDLLYERIRER